MPLLGFRFELVPKGIHAFIQMAIAAALYDLTHFGGRGLFALFEEQVPVTTGQDSSGNSLHQLVFTSNQTGKSNAVELTVSGDTGGTQTDATGLSRLTYSAAVQNLSDPGAGTVGATGSAQDAALSVNGVGISSSSNVVANAVSGVTLTLKKTTTVGSPASLTVGLNKAQVTKNLETLVSSYNSVLSTIQSVAGYNAETKQGAILLGDFAVRDVETQLRSVLGAPVSGVTGAFSSLVEVGIKTGKGGILSVDQTKLNNALDTHYDDIAQLFAIVGTASDPLVNFDSVTDDVKAGKYNVNVTQLATQGGLTGGAAITSLNIDANNDTFRVQVDGVSSADIQVSQGLYLSNADLASQIQSRINGDTALRNAGIKVSVTVDGSNRLVINSAKYGSASAVNITSVDTNTTAALGLSVATGTAGVDVAGTINGKSATGTGRYLKSDTGDSKGLRVEVVGGATGNRGHINFTSGVADKLDSLLGVFLAKGGAIGALETGIKKSLQGILTDRTDLDRRITRLQTRLTKQFVGLDSLLSGLQSTSNFLAQQLGSLNNSSR